MALPERPHAPASTYHHGDLHRALLDSAQAIMVETGRWDFSLREVARRAGVSHNAPYRHFADKDALLAAIGVAGYETLAESIALAVVGLSAPPILLAAMGNAYVAFGVANPALYRLMFGQAFPSGYALPAALVEAIDTARGNLHDVIHAGALDGSFEIDPNDTMMLQAASLTAWSVVHGLTLLTIDDIIGRNVGSNPAVDLSGQVIDITVFGIARKKSIFF